ncbi:hypothetical protein BDQ17DRAFT_1300236 [Cyathus striatus]|nr:hypothetical protein BDQ17DRAFT_1300236 [Cyathus striatus]
MSSHPPSLCSLARSKLHLSIGSAKDNCSLHRWVLLKNSIIHSPSHSANASTSELHDMNPVYPLDSLDNDVSDKVLGSDEADSFMFPDAGNFVGSQSANVDAVHTEAQWLDSMLQSLGDDDDDYDAPEDDEEHFLSPLISPMSSSDDLPNQPSYFRSSTSVSYSTYPYLVPYPPSPQLYSLDSFSSLPAPYEVPLPYHYTDDSIEDLPVPDAIEDTSDDESDAPSTPSTDQSNSSLLMDAALVPLPGERSRLRHTVPHVFVDADNGYYSRFESDPLPFPDDQQHFYNLYAEC